MFRRHRSRNALPSTHTSARTRIASTRTTRRWNANGDPRRSFPVPRPLWSFAKNFPSLFCHSKCKLIADGAKAFGLALLEFLFRAQNLHNLQTGDAPGRRPDTRRGNREDKQDRYGKHSGIDGLRALDQVFENAPAERRPGDSKSCTRGYG